MERLGRDVVLLSPLVGEVVTKGPGEDYLSVIVDITSNLIKQSASNSLSCENIYQKFAKLLVQRIGRELHRAGDDDFCGDCVEDLLALVYDQPRHVSDYLPLEELFAHVDLGQTRDLGTAGYREEVPGYLGATFGPESLWRP